MNSWVEHKITMALSLAILGGMFGPDLYRQAALDRRPPVTVFERSEVLNSPVPRGGAVIVRTWRNKVREDCPVTSTRHATNIDGVNFTLPSAQWRGGDKSARWVDIAYPLIPEMAPGQYALYVTVTYACPGDLTFTLRAPPTLFRVQWELETD